MIKGIIFDFDGVIVESVDIKTAAFAKLFEPDGKAVMDEVVQYHLKNTGVSRYDKFKYIYKNILKKPLSDTEFNGLCDSFARLVIEEVVNAGYVAGAEKFLKDFHKVYDLYVASATPQKEIETIVSRRGISGMFKKIYGSPLKKADAVKDVIEKGRYDPQALVYVGDALSDLEAAAANSVPFIARINGNEELFKDIDCVRVKDLRSLESVLNNIPGQKVRK